MSFGQRMNMCNITFIVSSFGIFRHYKIFCVNEKYVPVIFWLDKK